MDTEFLFPEAASSYAAELDRLYLFEVAVTAFFTALIFVLIMGFAIKYRRGNPADRSNPPTSILLEVTWTVIPLVIALIMFGWGALLFVQVRRPPADAIEINVVGKQWMWKMQHPDGRREINTLHVPVGQAVRLRMVSEDVIHSFFVPAFRTKMDVLPGRYTTLWFQPTKIGRYHLFCAEYCGTEHAQMIGSVHVMGTEEYAEWVAATDPGALAPELVGQRLFERHRCGSCHSGEEGARGPSLAGLYGSRVPLKDGSAVIADEDYLRASILNPRKHVVAGFDSIMPSFDELLTEDDALQLIAYIKTLQTEGALDREPNDEQDTQ